MPKFAIPNVALEQHIAVLGKTGSGKSSTAKLIIEHEVSRHARVCILDPIKSDWWGLTAGPNGLPLYILGGPHGHVPLHAESGKVIGELVASGALPLSIIDMAHFEPGGLSKFFVDFAQTLLRKMKGVVYLVLEESHLFAPKERSGIGPETMAIHWAKMLATAGRSKGIRLILITQRTQALHNALLGSCDTLIAHRLTAPADQAPVKDWLKANVEKEIMEKVSSSLSSLPTGSAWVCSGEAKLFELTKFPRIKTYDNTATPTGFGKAKKVATRKVDLKKLGALIGSAVEEAKQNDPRLLKEEIAKLKREIRQKSVEKVPVGASEAAVEAAYDRGFRDGWGSARGLIESHASRMMSDFNERDPGAKRPKPKAGLNFTVSTNDNLSTLPLAKTQPQTLNAEGLTGAQRRILAALGFWASVGHHAPTRAQVGAVAGYAFRSGSFKNSVSALNVSGMITKPTSASLALAAGTQYDRLTDSEAKEKLYSLMSGAERKIVDALLSNKQSLTRAEVGEVTGYEPTSGSFKNSVSALNVLGVIVKPSTGTLAISDWAREIL